MQDAPSDSIIRDSIPEDLHQKDILDLFQNVRRSVDALNTSCALYNQSVSETSTNAALTVRNAIASTNASLTENDRLLVEVLRDFSGEKFQSRPGTGRPAIETIDLYRRVVGQLRQHLKTLETVLAANEASQASRQNRSFAVQVTDGPQDVFLLTTDTNGVTSSRVLVHMENPKPETPKFAMYIDWLVSERSGFDHALGAANATRADSPRLGVGYFKEMRTIGGAGSRFRPFAGIGYTPGEDFRLMMGLSYAIGRDSRDSFLRIGLGLGRVDRVDIGAVDPVHRVYSIAPTVAWSVSF